jgi:hypothetical protein
MYHTFFISKAAQQKLKAPFQLKSLNTPISQYQHINNQVPGVHLIPCFPKPFLRKITFQGKEQTQDF